MHIRDVAKHLKMSVATVSRALNPATQSKVRPKTREKIWTYVQKVNFRPNRTARELSTGRTYSIGILLPATFDSFFFNDHTAKVLAGVYETLGKRPGYTCKLLIIPRGKSFSSLEQQVFDARLDGLLLSSISDRELHGSRYFPTSLLKGWKKPTVVLGMPLRKNKRVSTVFASNYEAAYNAVTYLVQRGHRKIATIQIKPSVPDTQDRFRGYKAALKDHKLKYDSSLLAEGQFLEESKEVLGPGKSSGLNLDAIQSGYRETIGLFRSKGSKPTAIFCANDEMAVGAVRALQALRIPCPQEVAVMGFDGIDMGEALKPRLSTVDQSTRQIAATGTELLLDLVEGKQKGPISKNINMSLRIRDSA